MKYFNWVMVPLFVFVAGVGAVKGGENVIEEGKKVKFEYTLTVNGEVVDTSEGKAPLEYTHGQGNIIKGLEKELLGMKVGDEKSVTVSPDEGYGQINPEAIREVPKTIISDGGEPQKGMMVRLQDPQGGVFPAIIMDVKEETLVLNFNHPLAGQELKFDVKIMSIE